MYVQVENTKRAKKPKKQENKFEIPTRRNTTTITIKDNKSGFSKGNNSIFPGVGVIKWIQKCDEQK